MIKFFKMENKDIIQSNKRQAVTIFIAFSLLLYTLGYFTQATISASEKNGLNKVYHVYVDQQYIGKVDEQAVVKEVVQTKLKDHEDSGITNVVDEEITYIAEKSFNPSYDNDKVERKLDNMLTIKAEAYELKIADEVLGYFSDEKVIKEILTQYQMTYLKDEDIEESELLELIEEVLPPPYYEDYIKIDEIPLDSIEETALSAGESQLVDISIVENIEISEQRVTADDIIDHKEGLTLLKQGTLEDEKHKVAEGEVLGNIAKQYDLKTKELLELNPSITEDTVLQIDQKLNVTAFKPFVDVIVNKEEVVEESISYETEIVETEEMYKGEQKVKQKGKNGKKEVHYQIEKTNNKETNREILNEDVIKKPIKKIVVKGTKVIPSRGSGTLIWPANGGYVSSGFGHRWGRLHKGIDIARPSNRTIKAADHGVIVSTGYEGGYGNKIVINHNNGMKTVYAHLSSINVRVGQKVEKGSAIGVMGSTGNSTGTHLHFEVYQNGAVQNPSKYY